MPRGRLLLITALYVTQALPIGLFERAFPILLYREGISLQNAGLVRLVLLPWALKFLWAPWVDRIGSARFGMRKSWIVPLQLAAAGITLSMLAADLHALTDPAGSTLRWILLAVLLLNFLCATQDIATDGLAYKLLRYADRGPGNGLQAAGYQLGLVLGGGLMLLLFAYLGWQGILLVLAALMLLPLAILIPYPEPAAVAQPQHVTGLAVVKGFFRQPGMGKWALLLCAYLLGNSWAFAVYRLFLVDAGLANNEIFLMLDVVGVLVGAAGAIVGGLLLRTYSRPALFMGALVLVLFCLALYVIPALGYKNIAVLYAAGIANKLAGGVAGAALFTIMMDKCRPAHAGTDFTLQQCLFNLATITAAFSGALAGRVGYAAFFAVCICMAAAAFVLAFVNRRVLSTPQQVT